MIICITGFMQEYQDKREFWTNLIAKYKYSEVFAVSWNALSMENFFSAGAFDKSKNSGWKKGTKILKNLLNIKQTAAMQFVYAVD